MAVSVWTLVLLMGCGLVAGMPTIASPVGDEGVSLLARNYRLTSHVASPSESGDRHAPACATLEDHGSHFTVEIEVGTPAQKFSVVADTGSDSLIIPSCICVKQGACSGSNRCFTGTNKSSTFELYTTGESQDVVEEVVTFGSGQIKGVIARDNVSVGGKEVFMADGLLLMVDQALDLTGPFEGILGLGLPKTGESQMAETEPNMPPMDNATYDGQDAVVPIDGMEGSDIEDIIKRILGGGGGDVDVEAESAQDMSSKASVGMMGKHLSPKTVAAEFRRQMDLRKKGRAMAASRRNSSVPQVRSFLQQANVSRFSVCFNSGESGGVLRLGVPEMPKPLRSVGREHWGVDFRGISVGASEPQRLQICSKEDMLEGQETPCGAIPDSGTTFMMGPQEHLDQLYETLCDGWQRCADNYTALVKAAAAANAAAAEVYGIDPFGVEAASKGRVLEYLLQDCGSWLGDEKGLNEMPPLKFHLADAGEEEEHLLEFAGVDYVVQVRGNATEGAPEQLFCQLAFSAMEYPTQKNGPVWIIGLPTFYAYTVTYDTKADPPSMSFVSTAETPCGGCGAEVGLLTSEAIEHAKSAAAHRQPRRLDGPPRLPSMDTFRGF